MAKPCGFAIEFNPLGTPPLSLYSSTRDGAPHAGVDDGVAGAARCAWTGGRSGGVAHRASAGWAAVLRPVPSPRQTTTVLWGGEGGPSAGALVQAAVRPGAVLRRLRARPSEAGHEGPVARANRKRKFAIRNKRYKNAKIKLTKRHRQKQMPEFSKSLMPKMQ